MKCFEYQSCKTKCTAHDMQLMTAWLADSLRANALFCARVVGCGGEENATAADTDQASSKQLQEGRTGGNNRRE